MSSAIKIGWASRDITPERPVMVRGQFNLRVAQRVQDRLTATALALETEDGRVIVVSIDACGIEESVLTECREQVAARLPGFDVSALVISGTHTHTAPFAGRRAGLQMEQDYLAALRERFPDYMTIADYTRMLVAGITGAACEAWEGRESGSIGWGYGYAAVGENRRVRYFDDRAVMYGSTAEPDFSHVEGHVDHGVNLLFTYGPDEALTGVLVNLACPSQASEGGQDFISADFWHETREEVRARHGAALFVLPQCSAAGDQSPHRLIHTRAEERMLTLKHGEGLDKTRNLALRRDIARRIADAVDDAEPAVRKDLRETVPLQCEQVHLDLPHWHITDQEYSEACEQIADYAATLEQLGDTDKLDRQYTVARSRIAWFQRVIDRYEHPPTSIPIEMQVVRLGDIAFVSVPFEYYLDFGDRIKGRSPALQTFIVQLSGAGRRGIGGYLATERAARGTSYGAVPASCQVSPAGGQVIVEAALSALAAMFRGQT